MKTILFTLFLSSSAAATCGPPDVNSSQSRRIYINCNNKDVHHLMSCDTPQEAQAMKIQLADEESRRQGNCVFY